MPVVHFLAHDGFSRRCTVHFSPTHRGEASFLRLNGLRWKYYNEISSECDDASKTLSIQTLNRRSPDPAGRQFEKIRRVLLSVIRTCRGKWHRHWHMTLP